MLTPPEGNDFWTNPIKIMLTDKKKDSVEDTKIVVHPHPLIEMQIKNQRKDELGNIAECVLFNKESNSVESSFFLDEEKAKEIIGLMKSFLDNLKR